MLKLLLVVIVFAALTYAVVWAIQRRGILPASSARSGRPSRPAPKPPTRYLAPDDDPDFLRDLDRKRKQAGDAE